MSKLVVIENTVVRQDAFGRYCLNDLHRAAVAQGKATESQRPSKFLRSQGIRKILKCLGNNALNTMHGGIESGIWAVETLAIRYTTWLKKETIIEKNRATTACNYNLITHQQEFTDKINAGLILLDFAKTELNLKPSEILNATNKLGEFIGIENILLTTNS
ncbi:KilA-N domain-containing protein [Arsenophonus sp.]|uniref:KilA-N domain-containing protein n=1 Tax=Arsenophonus sp. TaxID=1872640 RepID=UPI00285C78F0|nr:KilA-N domain-containing protein [Arsenophonus sp.]MDR5616807.1 KilA-N domain-containing protein [Arsenophonus sp.]MDR5618327.1 KilA-N domain-containing protein [Arsenophonus sp.]